MFRLDAVELLIRIPLVLLALTVHECCHAYFALRMGDPTAYRMGRVTLNPLRHLDFMGTLCLLFAPIGWAKPVPINPLNFYNRRMGILVSTAAGPLSNLAQAILFALVIRGLVHLGGSEVTEAGHRLYPAFLMCLMGVLINVGLAVFNFLPLFPLDGFHITAQLVSPSVRESFEQTAAAGPFVILGIIVLEHASNVDILGRLLRPPVLFILRHVAGASSW